MSIKPFGHLQFDYASYLKTLCETGKSICQTQSKHPVLLSVFIKTLFTPSSHKVLLVTSMTYCSISLFLYITSSLIDFMFLAVNNLA
jgi:hypothetical protein